LPFLILFALSWSAFAVFADKSRWRQFLPAALLAMLMSLCSDVMLYSYPLWVYRDGTGLLSVVYVHLLDDWGIYPVTAYLFLQFFPHQGRVRSKVTYFLAWTTGVILLEALFCEMGWMKHQLWWSLFYSYCADWVIFYTLLQFHNLYNRKSQIVSNKTPQQAPLIHASDLTGQLKTNLSQCTDTIRALGLEFYPLLEQPNVKIMLFEIPSDTNVPNHFHEDDECFFLLQGELVLIVDTVSYHIQPGQLVNMGKNKPHSVQNRGHESVLLLSIFLPHELNAKWSPRTREDPCNTSQALSF
jgi:quercetin dioxygenase-like cupin family protein